MQPVLHSRRLILRLFWAADAPEVQSLASDPRIAATTTTIPHPYPDGAAEQWIAGHAAASKARQGATFAVTVRGDNALVGAVSLLDVSDPDTRAELGYRIGVPFWGQGICTEAVVRVMEFAGESWGLTRIVARCMARNPASARVMEKAGLLREGHLQAHIRKNGRYEDVLLYGLSHASRREG